MNISSHGGGCGHSCCLRIQDLSVKIGNDSILSGINLHVHCGELVALIGPNGAGKSTLFKAILGQQDFDGIISFAVPFLMLGLPLFDTCSAIVRRVSHGQSPMAPDRSHVHHKLIDMGFSQKQAVAVLYVISAILGLSAVVLTTSGELRAMVLLLALCVAGAVGWRLFTHRKHNPPTTNDNQPFFGEEDVSDK